MKSNCLSMSLTLLLTLVLILSMAGCHSKVKGESFYTESSSPAEANPQQAIQEIYEDIDILDLDTLLIEDVEEQFGIDRACLEDFYVVAASGRFGLANVAILRPAESRDSEVREALYLYKDKLIKQTENYDVKDSRRIAQDALVYDQGGFVILLMLDENEKGQAIIDKYIPR